MKLLYPLILVLCSALAYSQPPNRPLAPYSTWSLPGYHAVDPASTLMLPADMSYDRVSSVTFTNEGHLLVLHRGPQPLLEFDRSGAFVRAFGDDLALVMAHGLDVDDSGNIWVTDLVGSVVLKLDANGKVLLTLGTKGENGAWSEAEGTHLFHQPNETALDSAGNIYVAQGHLAAEPRILKFTADGKFIKQWGTRGDGPGQFAAAHSIKIDSQDRLYVADRENQRIEIFDTEGNLLDEWKYDAMVCALYLHDDGFLYMTSGFDGEFAKVDMTTGALVGSLGSSGKDIGQFGEAHYLALDGEENVFVADVVNRRVQVFARD